MARELGADSLRYLPIESIARAVGRPASQLCQACITGRYPTPYGQRLYTIALENANGGSVDDPSCGDSPAENGHTVRTYEAHTPRSLTDAIP
jgi:hypothetical protein